jgi:flagellar hook-length control protein FliK
MVPFSFENITRSAALDSLKAFPVSEAARATHESFESHLQAATAATPGHPTRETAHDDNPRERPTSPSTDAPGNEPARQTNNEARSNDDRVHEDDTAEATAASKRDSAHDDEDVEQEAVTGEEVGVATIEEQRAAIQELELTDADDSNDNADDAATGKLADAALSGEESELDASLAKNADLPDEQGAGEADGRQVERNSSAPQTVQKPESQVDATETNEEVVPRGSGDDAVQDEVPPESATPQRGGDPSDIAANQPTDETPDAATPSADATSQRRSKRSDIAGNQPTDKTPEPATQSVDAALVEAAADTASDDNSRQRRNQYDPGSTQPIGPATTADDKTATSGTPSRFAQHLLAKAGDTVARGTSLTDADQARFVDRVARAVQATGDRGGTLRLRLSPPELGSLTLEIKVQGGAVTARVEADTPAARTLLIENLPLLRERLAEHGMRVDQFDVDLTDRHAGGTPDDLQQNDQQQEGRPRSKNSSREPEETPRSKSQEASTPIGSGQLNIIV